MFMLLLALLIEDHDRRNAMLPDNATPAERPRFLLEHSGKTPAVLLPIFGRRSHVHEALNGKRKIRAEQARKLGEVAQCEPGGFPPTCGRTRPVQVCSHQRTPTGPCPGPPSYRPSRPGGHFIRTRPSR